MPLVPAPVVIAPLVIDQTYVAPAPASGTLAALPIESGQAVPPVVMTADGMGLTTTVVEAEALPPHGPGSVTVTVYVPATVMPVGFCCVEVKPPGPVQEYTVPLPLAKRLTVEPAQAGPLFVAFANGAGPGGQRKITVVEAVPVIDGVTVS